MTSWLTCGHRHASEVSTPRQERWIWHPGYAQIMPSSTQQPQPCGPQRTGMLGGIAYWPSSTAWMYRRSRPLNGNAPNSMANKMIPSDQMSATCGAGAGRVCLRDVAHSKVCDFGPQSPQSACAPKATNQPLQPDGLLRRGTHLGIVGCVAQIHLRSHVAHRADARLRHTVQLMLWIWRKGRRTA